MISYLNLINKGQKNISANSYYFSDPEFDHRNDLKEMSDHYGWKINTHEIKSQDIIDKFETVFDNQDEPYPGIVTIAKYLLIEKSYPDDCKVILEGQGGDEMGAGYKYVFPLHILDMLKNFNFISAYNEIKKFNESEKNRKKDFYTFFINSLKGFFSGGISADGTRSKINEILNSNVKCLYGITFETAYAKLGLAYKSFKNEKKRNQFLKNNNFFEKITF